MAPFLLPPSLPGPWSPHGGGWGGQGPFLPKVIIPNTFTQVRWGSGGETLLVDPGCLQKRRRVVTYLEIHLPNYHIVKPQTCALQEE